MRFFVKMCLTRCKTPCYTVCVTSKENAMAPNKPDPTKRILNARVDRELYEKLKRMADAAHKSMTDIIIEELTTATKHIKLTAEDYEEIARQIREAESKR